MFDIYMQIMMHLFLKNVFLCKYIKLPCQVLVYV